MDILCLDFINSEFRDFRGRWVRDDLMRLDWLHAFLARWNLQLANSPDAVAITNLFALRALLRRMIEALAEGPIPDETLAHFNAIVAKPPVHRHLIQDGKRYRVAAMPVEKDWDWVCAEIAASFASLLTDHDPSRLKLCANVYCQGAFYDDSKSRTKQYCTADKCASLWKARRARARQKIEVQHSSDSILDERK